MDRNFKDYRLKLLVAMLLLITCSCEKDTQNEIAAQKSFIAPSIEIAKSYFNANSKYAASTSIQSKNSQSTSYVDWEQSKEKT
jgi:hypothetical protein